MLHVTGITLSRIYPCGIGAFLNTAEGVKHTAAWGQLLSPSSSPGDKVICVLTGVPKMELNKGLVNISLE